MQKINTEELKALRREKENLHVVNVLPEDAFRQQHIPGTINIPQDSQHFVDQLLVTTGDKQQPVVVYCAGEDCHASEEATEKLENAGFTEVYDYSGGIQAWAEAGEPVHAGA